MKAELFITKRRPNSFIIYNYGRINTEHPGMTWEEYVSDLLRHSKSDPSPKDVDQVRLAREEEVIYFNQFQSLTAAERPPDYELWWIEVRAISILGSRKPNLKSSPLNYFPTEGYFDKVNQ